MTGYFDSDGHPLRVGDACMVVCGVERVPPAAWLGAVGVVVAPYWPGRTVGPRVVFWSLEIRSRVGDEAPREFYVWASTLRVIRGRGAVERMTGWRAYQTEAAVRQREGGEHE